MTARRRRADSAAPSPASARRTTRDRTFTALAFALLLILGILASSQIRSLAEERRRLESTRLDYESYARLIDSENAYLADLRTRMDELAVRKESLQESILSGAGDTEALAALREARQQAGFTAVTGSGVAVTLDDSDLRTPDMDPTASIIHDADVRLVVDLLRAGGAVAISVNGQRIVPTSELICNGPTILINGIKYPVPYVVEAVGNPDLLLSMIRTDETLGYRQAEGVRITSVRKDEVAIPAFDGADRVDTLIDALTEVNP